MKCSKYAALLPACILSVAAHSDWVLDESKSQVNFVSVKKDSIGEVHSFSQFTAVVGAEGNATLTINLSSVDTGIEIRDQRMQEHLFEVAKFATATASIKVDVKRLSALKVGETEHLKVNAKVKIHGVEGAIPLQLMVVKVTNKNLLVSTAAPFIIDAASFGLEAGVNKLKTLAALPNIALAVPVTAVLMFQEK